MLYCFWCTTLFLQKNANGWQKNKRKLLTWKKGKIGLDLTISQRSGQRLCLWTITQSSHSFATSQYHYSNTKPAYQSYFQEPLNPLLPSSTPKSVKQRATSKTKPLIVRLILISNLTKARQLTTKFPNKITMFMAIFPAIRAKSSALI